LDKWFDAFDKKNQKTERKIERKKRTKRMSTRVAIIFISIIVVGASLTLGVESFRVRLFNFIVTEKEHYTDLSVLEEDSTSITNNLPDDWTNYYFPTYMTDGYSLDNYSKNSSHKNLYFSNGNGTIFLLDQLTETSFVAQIDTEDAELLKIIVNGNEGVYTIKNGKTTISWVTDGSLFILSGPESLEEMTKIANSIKKID